MTQFGGPLRQMGFDWQTSGAMLGKFEKEGVNTELVVGSLRIALGKMAKDGIKEPAKELQGMIEKIKAAGTAGEANALSLSMFGAKAGPDMAAAIREGRMDLSGLLKTLKDSPETINQAAADTATFSGKLAKMRHVMEIAFEPVSRELLDSLENLTPYLKTASDAVAGFAKKIAEMSPAQQAAILKYALMAAAAGPVILTLGKVVHSIGNTIGTFTKFSRTIADAGGIMKYLATPGGIVIVVLIALVAAAILVATHWDQVKIVFNNFKQTLKDNETAIRKCSHRARGYLWASFNSYGSPGCSHRSCDSRGIDCFNHILRGTGRDKRGCFHWENDRFAGFLRASGMENSHGNRNPNGFIHCSEARDH